MIKPSRVEFGAHARNLLPKARKSLELLGRVRTEIDEGKDLRQSAAGKHFWRGAVCREQRDIKPGVKEHLPDRAHVSVVAAERSVFVLDLRHQNGAAARDLERSKLCANVQHIAASSCEETGISAADPDVRRGQQPSGKTAEVPFSATVGTSAVFPDGCWPRRTSGSAALIPVSSQLLAAICCTLAQSLLLSRSRAAAPF